jgi:Phage capsid family
MASVTLSQSALLSQDELIAGVIENVITVNRFFDVLPFDGIEGNALAYNRENALGDVQMLGVDGTITAKAAATFTHVTSTLTTIVGDAEVNGLIQATRSNINDQKAVQVASKAKSCGRQYQNQMINGDGTGDNMTGLLLLVDPTQVVQAGTAAGSTGNGNVLSFADLDNAIDLVVDKDGEVDYIMMNARTIRSYNALLRALGGARIDEVVTLPSGKTVPAYRGIPVFRNDWIPLNQTVGGTTTCTTVLVGTLDDGSRSHGIAGLTAANFAGINVKEVGERENSDNTLTRVVWYCGLALFSVKGLAALTGVTN